MNATSTIIGRLTVLLVAVAILIGVSGRAAGAEPIDINSGPATVARGLCTGSGGDWNITNNVFFCTYGDGHGWACDMDTNPVQCWSFFKVHTGGIRVTIGSAQIAVAKVAPNPNDPVNSAVVQAQIASAQVSPVSSGSGTKVSVGRAGAVAGGVIAKTTAP